MTAARWRAGLAGLALVLVAGSASVRPALAQAGAGAGAEPQARSVVEPSRLAKAAPALETWVEEALAKSPHAGLSLGVSYQGERWTSAFGYADLRRRRKATPQTSYRMASVTKMFTAVAVLQLAEQGKVDLDADVRRYVPRFPEKRWPVTVRHLLGHLGGVSHYRNRAKETHFTRRFTTAEALDVFRRWELEARPGDEYIYTSYGYNLLGAVVEAASGMSYAAYLQRHIFRPLGMKRSAVEDRRRRNRTWAQGYRLRGERLRKSEAIDISSRFAGGGTRSTVVDMLSFGEGLIGGRLVDRETLGRMQRPMATSDGMVTDYGMGMAAYPLGGHWVIAHAGAQPETSTLLMIFPAEQLVIAIAQNLEDQWTFNHRLAGRVFELLVLGGERRRGLAGASMGDHLMAAGLIRVFSHGLALYRLRQGRIDDGPGDILAAFEEADRILDPGALAADPPAGWDAIQLGLGPKTSRALPEVGAFMAAVIARARGEGALDRYGPASALTFVRDYVETCAEVDCPTGLLPGEAIRAFVDRTGPAFLEAYPRSLRFRKVEPGSSFEEVAAELRAHLVEAPVVPDFAWELREVGEHHLDAGDAAQARPWLELTTELFPQDTRATVALALLRYADGRPAEGDALLTRATSMPDADDRVKLSRLRYQAWHLDKAGFDSGSRDLLKWAAAHHGDADTWDRVADQSEDLGELDEALSALEEAAAADPEDPQSARRRSRADRLRARLARQR